MPAQKLIERLQASIGLSEDDRSKLVNMPETVKTFADGEYVLREGERAFHCALVMNGFLVGQKIVGTRNQILSVYVPGDMPDSLCIYCAWTMTYVVPAHLRLPLYSTIFSATY
ncbi:cyclic nucleotide-binding domain-containing protein [Bradyrhizobium sp. LeoA1S1]